jgi:hypothetical protein
LCERGQDVTGALLTAQPSPAADGTGGEAGDGGDELVGALALAHQPGVPQPGERDDLGFGFGAGVGTGQLAERDAGVGPDARQDREELVL